MLTPCGADAAGHSQRWDRRLLSSAEHGTTPSTANNSHRRWIDLQVLHPDEHRCARNIHGRATCELHHHDRSAEGQATTRPPHRTRRREQRLDSRRQTDPNLSGHLRRHRRLGSGSSAWTRSASWVSSCGSVAGRRSRRSVCGAGRTALNGHTVSSVSTTSYCVDEATHNAAPRRVNTSAARLLRHPISSIRVYMRQQTRTSLKETGWHCIDGSLHVFGGQPFYH